MRHFHRAQFFEQFGNPAEAQARFYVYSLRRFYMAMIGYSLLVPMLFAINFLTFHGHWWAWWPTLGMGIGLAFKGSRILGWSLFWNDAWEEKKVAEILARKEGK